jgi:hypothetical protein
LDFFFFFFFFFFFLSASSSFSDSELEELLLEELLEELLLLLLDPTQDVELIRYQVQVGTVPSLPVLRIRILRIRLFLGLLDLDPDSCIIMQK